MSAPVRVRAFAPATVANVGCGFDVLGLALETPGDRVEARRREEPGVVLEQVTGDGDRLPRESGRNTASVAAAALLQAHAPQAGVALSLHKGLPLASGLGSSAASAVAAVKAVDTLLGLGLPDAALLAAALEGERVAAGAAHPDNAAAALHGGLILARPGTPPEILQLPVLDGLHVALVHPPVEMATAEARALLDSRVALADAVAQWADVGGLVHALHTGDAALLSRCLRDRVAEPRRAASVPAFVEMRQAARDAGALGAGLSGAGPSVFALCRERSSAEAAAAAMSAALSRTAGLDGRVLVSPVARQGARIVEAGP